MRFGEENQAYPIMVVGGGVAGIAAALDLGNLGQRVHLVEINHWLGGQVSKLDKLYPTDHCAFCPLWTEIKKCKEHPYITVHTCTSVKELREEGVLKKVTIVRRPPVIDEEKCVFCGFCESVCPVEKSLVALDNHVNSVHAIGMTQDHVYPPAYTINEEACTKCGLCEEICPTGAIDYGRSDEESTFIVKNVIWATGFGEADLSGVVEYGSGTHQDIMTSMDFEGWISETGPNKGSVRKKSTLAVPTSIAFVQCAGARDKRMFPYCSAVCCMHALKQVHWVKKRSPQTRCTIFFTDLRTVGKNYYAYARQAIGDGNLEFIRGRPGLILPLPEKEGIGIKYENTMTQKTEIRKFDMVVLNGALAPRMRQLKPEQRGRLSLDSCGFVVKGGNSVSGFACGFSLEPADVTESVIQGSSAAWDTIQKPKPER
jgi:heterodisulfide reductase subunit A